MMQTTITPNVDVEILRRILDAKPMPSETAQYLLELSLAPSDAARVEDLSHKANEGILSADEERELDEYLRIGHVMEVMQLRARRVLKQAIP